RIGGPPALGSVLCCGRPVVSAVRISSPSLPPALRTATGLVGGAALVAVVTGIVFALKPVAPVLSLGVLYLFAVLPAAIVWARASPVLGSGAARIELESLRRPQADETAHPLVAGDRRVGQLVVAAAVVPDAAVVSRVLPALASLLASAVDRERLALKAVEAESLRRSDAVKTT